jgi:PPOX class probable FMN-dependent enzyme
MSHVIDSTAVLEASYRRPAQRSLDKEVDHLDRHCRDYIAHAPFMVLASCGADGRVDASPKGGPPGFVVVLDDHHLAIPDLAGNNRLDSLHNVVEHDGVALLFLVPGVDETLRVNGRATVNTDPDVLDRCRVLEKTPNVAIVVDVETAYIHCAKALRRGSVWQPEEWPDVSDMATPACMLRDHIELDATVEQSAAWLEQSYRATLWEVGGEPAAHRPA